MLHQTEIICGLALDCGAFRAYLWNKITVVISLLPTHTQTESTLEGNRLCQKRKQGVYRQPSTDGSRWVLKLVFYRPTGRRKLDTETKEGLLVVQMNELNGNTE